MDQELRRYLEEMLDKGMPRELGIHFVTLERGHVRAGMPIDERHTNVYGMVHGGAMYTLADTTTGFAARTYGGRVVTLNGSMNYLTGSPKTTMIYCDGNVVRHGRRTIVVSAEVYDEFGTLMANGSYTLYVLGSDQGFDEWKEQMACSSTAGAQICLDGCDDSTLNKKVD